jgi:hypothetical protein
LCDARNAKLEGGKRLNTIRRVFLLALLALMPGCATVLKMAPTTATTSVDTSQQSVLIASLTLANQYHDSYQPNPIVVAIERAGGQQKSDRLNFQFDANAKVESDKGTHYLVRIPLAPGTYVIRGIVGGSGVFPVHGMFFLPLHYDIDVKPGALEYLGHIDATVVERKDGELRAGSMIPLIDQAVTGFSTGTWTVAVSDSSEHDLDEFKTAFPALAHLPIENDLLPAWDKQKATVWWEAH